MTSKKKKDKEKSPPSKETEGRSGHEQNTGEVSASESDSDKKSTEMNNTDSESVNDIYPADIEILHRALDAWSFSWFTPFFYHLTRAFAHYQRGQPLTTQHIFSTLSWMNQGEHATFLERLDKFADLILAEYEKYPGGRIVPIADKTPKR